MNIAKETEGKFVSFMPTALWLQARGHTQLMDALNYALSDVRSAIKMYHYFALSYCHLDIVAVFRGFLVKLK